MLDSDLITYSLKEASIILKVTPRSVWNFLPSFIPFDRYSIACGWSPVGLYSECSLNITSPFIII